MKNRKAKILRLAKLLDLNNDDELYVFSLVINGMFEGAQIVLRGTPNQFGKRDYYVEYDKEN